MIREILEYPDPRLRTIAKPVEEVTDDIRTLIDDMFETMYDARGIGLAATQVDVHKQIIVMDLSEDKTAALPAAPDRSSFSHRPGTPSAGQPAQTAIQWFRQ